MTVKRLTELFNVNNFIVSQVPSYLTIRTSNGVSSVHWITRLIYSEISHRFNQLNELGLIPDVIVRLLNFLKAPYIGDVQVTPSIFCSDIRYVISNPTKEFAEYCSRKGELATWKRLSQIKMRCLVEFTLDQILSDLTDDNRIDQ